MTVTDAAPTPGTAPGELADRTEGPAASVAVLPAPTTGTEGTDALHAAAEAALGVLVCFEAERPGDGRPRAAVEAVLGLLAGTVDEEVVAAAGRAAHAAAREAVGPAAVAAARAAAQLAAATRSPGQVAHVRRYADRARSARALDARRA